MHVKTADLKNNLSKYLHRVRETGETLVVCDRNEPIATLSPIANTLDTEWHQYREVAIDRAKRIGLKIDIPPKRPLKSGATRPSQSLAPDRRSDISTIDVIRKSKNY